MAGGEITVERSQDTDYFSELFGLEKELGKKAVHLFWFLVCVDGVRAGGFLLIPRDAGLEMHAELREPCRGKKVLQAARLFENLIFDTWGPVRVMTSVLHKNRHAKIIDALMGFKRAGEDEKRTYYEKTVWQTGQI